MKSYLSRVPAFFLCLIALGCFFQACNDKAYFESSQELKSSEWAYSDTLDFRFSVMDTAQLYNMYLSFDYTDTFSTQNLYLRLHTKFPDGRRLSKLKSFDLFDAKGTSKGSCSGHRCTAKLILQDNAFFNQPGEYCVTLEQFTRTDRLSGMLKAGLVLEKSDKKVPKK
jgi:gliding motility-associated lipoprotein GldH